LKVLKHKDDSHCKQKINQMKTLENQTLLYDEDCPLCSLYTAGFIKAGMLDANGKKPFSAITADHDFIDVKRACNEIALVDNKNKTAIYGIDSLLRVIGNSFPWIEKTGNFTSVKYFLRKLYSFISYNRKVIIPNKTNEKALQCVPDFNYRYRFIYLVFATLVTAAVLFRFSLLVPSLPEGNFTRELLLAFGQIVFQSLLLLRADKKRILNYAGNLMTVSIMGSLILLPVLILSRFIELPEIVVLGWFGFTVAVMFAEHARRVKLLQLPFFLCFSWVLYRLIALALILTL
jgi:hypothetical protein